MPAPADPYFIVQQIDRQYAIYASADRSLVLPDIETLGDARNHILDLIAADEAEAQRDAFEAACDELEDAIEALIAKQQAENAALDDFEAQAHAMAYGPAVTGALMTSAVVSASYVKLSTLTDGTVRVVIDIEPTGRAAAFALFDAPGVPVAVARLTNEAAVAHDRAHQAEAPADPLPSHKLPTPLSSRVAMTCGERSFWRFLEARTGVQSVDKEIAAALVRDWCGVESRSDIRPGSAAERAWNTMRADYEHYQRTGQAA